LLLNFDFSCEFKFKLNTNILHVIFTMIQSIQALRSSIKVFPGDQGLETLHSRRESYSPPFPVSRNTLREWCCMLNGPSDDDDEGSDWLIKDDELEANNPRV
jgi:hypothetical protein